MNNKLIKNFIMLILIFVLSINSFATFAFDNSGSAFITKAEFDALKSSFQSMIDVYNKNIDSKIDSAIASYLAGITISYERTLEVCSTSLEYPLTLRHLGPYDGTDVANISTIDNGEKLWTDELDVEYNGQRHGSAWWQKAPIKKRVNNRIKNFYNGNVATDSTKYKANEICNNYNVLGSLTSCVHHFSINSTVHESWGWVILMDVKLDNCGVTSGGQANKNTWTRTNNELNPTNNNRKTFPTETRPFYLGLWGQYHPNSGNPAASTRTSLVTTVTNKTKKWDRLVKTAGDSNWVEYTVNWANWLQSASFSSKKINDVLVSVARGSNATETYLPVLYDGKIKVTNIDNSKKDLVENITWTTEQEHTTRIETSNCVALHHIIEPGFVIDAENNKATGTDWSSTSLINGTRITYDETTPYKKDLVTCTMGEGILLTEVPDKMKEMSIIVKVDWPTTYQSTTSQKKYIMFSKEPITEDIINISQSVNANKYIDIATSKQESAPKSKLIELENGVKKEIYLGEFAQYDRIYYKITWGYDGANTNRWQEIVTISLPSIKGIIE